MTGTPTSTRDIIIRSADLAAARRFYENVLGLAVAHDDGSLVGYETGAFRLYVEQGPDHGPVFEFLVADVEATKLALLSAGCSLVEEDRSVPRCYVRDPFGLTFNIGKAG